LLSVIASSAERISLPRTRDDLKPVSARQESAGNDSSARKP
jgi:hypothetical protein